MGGSGWGTPIPEVIRKAVKTPIFSIALTPKDPIYFYNVTKRPHICFTKLCASISIFQFQFLYYHRTLLSPDAPTFFSLLSPSAPGFGSLSLTPISISYWSAHDPPPPNVIKVSNWFAKIFFYEAPVYIAQYTLDKSTGRKFDCINPLLLERDHGFHRDHAMTRLQIRCF